MGANFNCYTFRGTEKQLAKHHNQLQEDLCVRYGNDTYAGHLGILPFGLDLQRKTVYKSFDEAREYLEDSHSKWDQAQAIPYRDKRKKYYLVGGWCPE
ncbi:hypothetical protein LNTAR_15277 [Lentisphaera araneosa HTCC2155]|uniref:Uncharacterized protein n=1 Tax=Lentisphaera araneosa HTCC2155 TaxID=313628 RepID=A6DRI0_9BACT|nr:hypothetical protein [Lentisphaera araneosa]EDM25790.1 hypothetical protein LNTAR_15277 [Lentisphaera araneosa HTCC2155]